MRQNAGPKELILRKVGRFFELCLDSEDVIAQFQGRTNVGGSWGFPGIFLPLFKVIDAEVHS
jgi:hypothetical protein